jgi:3-methyladenine DNA glycosylase Tag
MRKFAEIYAIAAERKGDLDDRMGLMDLPKSREELAAIPDNRWLSGMTRCVFNVGFNWYVVGNMRPAFEEVFGGFEIGPCSMLNDDDLGCLISDSRIVHSGRKIRTVPENATFTKNLSVQHGGAGSFFLQTGRPRTMSAFSDI